MEKVEFFIDLWKGYGIWIPVFGLLIYFLLNSEISIKFPRDKE